MTETLGDRMKAYENEYRAYLPKNRFTIMRLDGRAFHSYTRGRQKPFDDMLINSMAATTKKLCEEVQGTQFAYTQSDEISLVLSDHGERTEAWFGGNIQKMVSVAAAIATAEFSHHERIFLPGTAAQFDARVFTMPEATEYPEVLNYLIWRQRDWQKNAVTMAAGVHYSHKELDTKTTTDRLAMLKDKGVDFYKDFEPHIQTGTFVVREAYEAEATWKDPSGLIKTETITRNRWVARAAPLFTDATNDGKSFSFHYNTEDSE